MQPLFHNRNSRLSKGKGVIEASILRLDLIAKLNKVFSFHICRRYFSFKDSEKIEISFYSRQKGEKF